MIEPEAADALFDEAIDILGDRPSSLESETVERWGEGNLKCPMVVFDWL